MFNSTNPGDLTHHFLIAMPSTTEGIFAGALIYLCDHSERGALGLLINRPIELDLAALFQRIDISLEIDSLQRMPVYFGGPVQTERGFVLHEPTEESYVSSMVIPNGLSMTTSKDVLEAIACGKGPQKFLLSLGHTGWGAGQLEEEISSNSWLTVPADTRIIFDVPAAERFNAALSLLGASPTTLSGQAGHA